MSQAGIVDIENSHPQIPTMFVANIGTAIPIANTIEILGQAVAAHSVPLQTVASGNTININVQYASAAASSVANNAGVASFNSSDFTVDANGFVTFNGAGALQTLTGNTGGAISPVAGNINTVGTGSITIAGSGNTLTTQLTGLTNHSLLVGAGTATITNLGVATNGQIPIGSTGADPVLANITSTDGSVTIINGAGTIDLSTTGFLSGTVTTVSNVTGDLITIALGGSALAYKFHFDVVAYNASTPAALGYAIDATARTTGVAATMVGIPDGDEDEDVVLQTDADWDVVASGNNAILRVFGVTGLTLHWKATGRYVTVG